MIDVVSTRSFVRRGRRVSGAVVAQLAQALTSLVLSIVAVRALGAEGLGTFGLLYSGLVLATALSTGLVGDALTVLDRRHVHLRSGLQMMGIAFAVLCGVVGAIVVGATGLVSWPSALLFALVGAVFVIEDLLRRLLMASLQFWSVVAVDLSCLVVTLVFLFGVSLATEMQIVHLLAAVLVAQAMGLAVALRLLTDDERWLAPWRGGDLGSVVRFGGWRAAQQGVRPATLTLTRTVIVLATSTLAFGELEAARVYAAPTMLVVGGVGGFLFATYAESKERPMHELLRRADAGAALLVVLVVLLGGAAIAVVPWAGDLVTGGSFQLDGVAVVGWVVFAAAAAILMPYGGLGAVRGLHVTVFLFRGVEAVVSVVAVVLVVSVTGASASWAPYALAVGSVVSGAVIRQRVLLPRARAEARDADALALVAHDA